MLLLLLLLKPAPEDVLSSEEAGRGALARTHRFQTAECDLTLVPAEGLR